MSRLIEGGMRLSTDHAYVNLVIHSSAVSTT
jgi:hypothetical protein